jgi:hypothetical protein
MVYTMRIYKFIISLIPIFAVACSTSSATGDADENAVKQSIGDALKKSSSVSDMEAFLHKNGFEYSTDTNAKEIHAIKRNVRKQNVTSKSISVKFTFQDGKITYFSTEVLFTGP